MIPAWLLVAASLASFLVGLALGVLAAVARFGRELAVIGTKVENIESRLAGREAPPAPPSFWPHNPFARPAGAGA